MHIITLYVCSRTRLKLDEYITSYCEMYGHALELEKY